MLKLLYTTDIHASPGHLAAMLKIAAREQVAAIIIGGDLIPHYLPPGDLLRAQRAYLVHYFLPSLKAYLHKHPGKIYLDMGNDDFADSRKVLESEEDGLVLIHNRVVSVSPQMDLIGYMIVPPTPFGRKDWEKPDGDHWAYAPGTLVQRRGVVSHTGRLTDIELDLSSKDTIAKDLKRLSASVTKPFLFVSHSPPYDTPLDIVASGHHVGSLSIRRFIEKWAETGKLRMSLHGHIHESPYRSGTIETRINGVQCINPGQSSGPGAKLRYVLLEITDSGIVFLTMGINGSMLITKS